MADPADVQVTTLREYMEVVEGLMMPDVPVWYRGTGRVAHTLTPSIYRHPSITDQADYLALELKLMQRFRERSIPFQRSPVVSQDEREWEMLFVMQHFGVPTRLLDWSENPHVGLYFALTSAKFDFDTGEATEDACVWALLPESWNRQALTDISYSGDVLSVGTPQLKWYMPETNDGVVRVTPVAMYGMYNSPRIVAQRGVFTIFGNRPDPMEEVMRSADFSSDTLTRITIPADSVAALQRSLFRTGITDSVVFPDLGGLAVELKRYFGYRV